MASVLGAIFVLGSVPILGNWVFGNSRETPIKYKNTLKTNKIDENRQFLFHYPDNFIYILCTFETHAGK